MSWLHGELTRASPTKCFFLFSPCEDPKENLLDCMQLVARGSQNREVFRIFVFCAPPYCSREGDVLEMLFFRGEEQACTAAMLLCRHTISAQGTH